MKDSHNNKGQAVSLKRRIFSVPTLLSFGIAVALIVFLATRFDLDWSTTWENIRGMNPWWYLLAFILYYLSFIFRGLRWRLLALNAAGTSSPAVRVPSALQCSQLILTGWFVNSIAWLRLGDAYRAYGFSEDSRGSFTWSLGTVFAERVLDMATIFIILIVSAILLTTTRDSTAPGYILIAAFVMAFALVVLILLMRVYGTRLGRRLPHRIEAAYHRFQQGTLGSFKQLPILLLLGLAAWVLEIARLYFVIQALDLSISLPLVALVALGHAILSTVPTPGGVGAVEPGVTGLLLLSLERTEAVSVALVDRSITYVSVILFGGLVFLMRHIAQVRRHQRQEFATAQARGQGTVADG